MVFDFGLTDSIAKAKIRIKFPDEDELEKGADIYSGTVEEIFKDGQKYTVVSRDAIKQLTSANILETSTEGSKNNEQIGFQKWKKVR